MEDIPMSTYIDFADLKSRIGIHQVAFQMLNIQATQKGNQYRGCCPVHKGNNPREFVITVDKGLWHCFGGCGGGDQIALVAKMRGLKQNEAAHAIEAFFGTVPTTSPAGATTTVHKTASPPLPQCERPGFDPVEYAKRLDPAHPSLAALGISPETLQAFSAGYASTGLLRGRLALPMRDTQGKILGFCGRALDGKEPHYIFPKNFQPSNVAFNWDRVRDTDFAYLCTDPIDVLKAHEGGIDNAIAALGGMDATFLQVLSLWMEENHIAAIEPM
jgi:DNA primase